MCFKGWLIDYGFFQSIWLCFSRSFNSNTEVYLFLLERKKNVKLNNTCNTLLNILSGVPWSSNYHEGRILFSVFLIRIRILFSIFLIRIRILFSIFLIRIRNLFTIFLIRIRILFSISLIRIRILFSISLIRIWILFSIFRIRIRILFRIFFIGPFIVASKIWGSQLWWRQHHTATCQRLEQLVGTLEQEFERAVKKAVCNENVHISIPWNLYAEIDKDLKLDPHITKRS